MSQHDYVIANDSGATVRADINSVLQAILSQNSGTSEPTSTAAGMMWLDTTGGAPYILKIRDAGNNHWLTVGTVNDPGSDGNMSVAAIEGTAVLSTGESGGTKFLREDGDGSCSWQTPTSIPSGMIAPFAYSSTPTNWLICDGSTLDAVSNAAYLPLWNAIGTTWGGSSSSSFSIPDLRGAFLRGTGSNGTHNMANGSDFAGPSVGSFENDQLQADYHQHAGATAAGSGYNKFYGNGGVRHWVNPNVAAAGYGTPRRGDETRPFNAGVNYCIKI